MRSPLISVVMPVYNALPYLPAAVNSILMQSYSNFEFLIFDDGSQDGSREYLSSLEDPRIKLNLVEHQGYGPLLNSGLNAARGEFIARMDADDIADISRFDQQVALLGSQPECVACGSNVQVIDSASKLGVIRQMPAKSIEIFQDLVFGKTPLCHPSSMFRKKIALEIGGYNESLVPAEDYDFWWRMLAKGTLLNIQLPLLSYREHSSCVSSVHRGVQRSHVEALLAKAVLTENFAFTKQSAEAYAAVICGKEFPTDCYQELFAGFLKVARRLLARMGNEPRLVHGMHQRFRSRIMKHEEPISYKTSENWKRYFRYLDIRPDNQSRVSFVLRHAFYRYFLSPKNSPS